MFAMMLGPGVQLIGKILAAMGIYRSSGSGRSIGSRQEGTHRYTKVGRADNQEQDEASHFIGDVSDPLDQLTLLEAC